MPRYILVKPDKILGLDTTSGRKFVLNAKDVDHFTNEEWEEMAHVIEEHPGGGTSFLTESWG